MIPNPLAIVVTDTTYNVVVTDEMGCSSALGSVAITVKPLPTAVLSISDNSICAGDQTDVSIFVSGSGPWLLHGFTILESGQGPLVMVDSIVTTMPFVLNDHPQANTSYHIESFTDQSTDCLNDTANWVNVSVDPLPIVDLGNDTTLCADADISLDAGNTSAFFVWSTGEMTQNILLDSSGLGLGTHAIWVRVDDGCINTDTVMVTFDPCTGIDEITDIKITAYPNPANETLFIECIGASGTAEIILMDDKGSVIATKRERLTGESLIIDLKEINPGFYFLQIILGEYSGHLRFVKE
jgi:hypothetical protein